MEGGLGGGDDFGVVCEGEVVAASEGEVGRTAAGLVDAGPVNAGDVCCGGGLGGGVWH